MPNLSERKRNRQRYTHSHSCVQMTKTKHGEGKISTEAVGWNRIYLFFFWFLTDSINENSVHFFAWLEFLHEIHRLTDWIHETKMNPFVLIGPKREMEKKNSRMNREKERKPKRTQRDDQSWNWGKKKTSDLNPYYHQELEEFSVIFTYCAHSMHSDILWFDGSYSILFCSVLFYLYFSINLCVYCVHRIQMFPAWSAHNVTNLSSKWTKIWLADLDALFLFFRSFFFETFNTN